VLPCTRAVCQVTPRAHLHEQRYWHCASGPTTGKHHEVQSWRHTDAQKLQALGILQHREVCVAALQAAQVRPQLTFALRRAVVVAVVICDWQLQPLAHGFASALRRPAHSAISSAPPMSCAHPLGWKPLDNISKKVTGLSDAHTRDITVMRRFSSRGTTFSDMMWGGEGNARKSHGSACANRPTKPFWDHRRTYRLGPSVLPAQASRAS